MADSIREALTAAVAKADSAPVDDSTDDAVSSSTVGTDESHDTPPLGADSNAAPDDADEQAPDSTVEGSAPVAAVEPEIPAPISWTREERAEWKNLSPAARKAVARREGDMQRAFQATAGAKKRLEVIDTATAQYKPLLDRYNTTIEAVLPPLLATRAALEVGTDSQKAELVANLCADFGIDITLLADAIDGIHASGPRQRVQPPPQMQRDPEVQALLDHIKEGKQARAAAAIAEVESLPNYDAVRFTMADLIEKARDIGQSLSLAKAHTLASQMHGFEVEANAPAVSASQAASILAKSRNAASSVAGAPKPTPPRKPGEGSVADEITALMSGRR